jgi:eukaryotic-like serine/threonine-protein kinase
MTAEQWRRVRELFEAALERIDRNDADPAKLGSWIEAQSSDAVVRAEVESLLNHHSRAGSFLEQPVPEAAPSLLDGDDVADDEKSTLAPGTVIGHYSIVRELGRGAMGRVYLAADSRLGRQVAIKILAPHLTGDASHRERLKREARAAAGLMHAGICTVHALEEIDGHLFIVSELVDGHTLREEIVRDRQPPAASIVATARELADALATAHAKGITHRDFKPENVMRDQAGRLKVLDFGLARGAQGAMPLTSATGGALATLPGILVGTPAYMSPEQLNGQPADARADVFAYGVVLYEYACGVHPFEASTPLALAARVLESSARPVADTCRHIPPAVAAVVDRCLRKSPVERFASAGEIVQALGPLPTMPADAPPQRFQTMWRVHQAATMLLYIIAGTASWWLKEQFKGPLTLWTFVAIGLAGTIAGVSRGHLLFTWRMNRPRLTHEWRRVRPAVVVIDLLIALGLASDGISIAAIRPLWGMLTIAFAAGVALSTTLMEPATTAAAFDHRSEPQRTR